MSAWLELVKKVKKENPSLSFKEVLIEAKKLYSVRGSGSEKKSHKKTKTAKRSKKSKSKKSRGKGRKTKRHSRRR